jgi:rSAM/selenodomain-associated transferase 1
LSHENVAIALAVMLRVPGREPVKSRLHAALGPHASTLLYRCFVLDTLDAAAQVPGTEAIVAFSPAAAAPAMAGLAPGMRRLAQRGDDLGARMANLVTDLLEAGHSAALVTGSDLPALPAARFVEAARALAGGDADVVLGPSEDGGYYLIGLTRSAPALFTDMRWSAPDVLAGHLRPRPAPRASRAPAPALVRRRHTGGPRPPRDDLASAVGAPAPGTVAWRTRRWLSAFPG